MSSDYQVLKRFWAKVKLGDGCWEWTGSRLKNGRTGKPGYGMFRHRKKLDYAHRFAWAAHFEPPGAMYVLHRCDNPACVRLDHLFLGTHRDNMLDMVAKDRWGNQTRKAA